MNNAEPGRATKGTNSDENPQQNSSAQTILPGPEHPPVTNSLISGNSADLVTYSQDNIGVDRGLAYPQTGFIEDPSQTFGSGNAKTLLVASIAPGGPSPTEMMITPHHMPPAGYYQGMAVHHGGTHGDIYSVAAASLPMDQGNHLINSHGNSEGNDEGYDHVNNDEQGVGEEIGEASDRDDSDFSEPVKLFVGQVPKIYEETDLFPYFSKYGAMEDVTIIRDKHTGQHRGCAFVTFISKEQAELCEEEMHNQFTFPGGKRPVQIRPASRNESGNKVNMDTENKLFVGMLPRNIAETTIRELFGPFGEITGVYLIRSNDGIKKGCAFVKFAHRESAIAAIDALNDTITLEGVQRPLIVKFADTKSQKRARQYHASLRDSTFGAPGAAIHGPGHLGQNGAPYYMSAGPHHPIPMYPGHVTPPPMGIATPQYSSHQQGQYPPNTHTSYPSSAQAAAQHPPPPNFMYQQMAPYGMPPGPDAFVGQANMGGMPKRSIRPAQHRYAGSNQHTMPDVVNPRPREGPAGANLFIYHLPHDLTDADLATAFNPFGNVISAKVYVDKYTGESKGFGFVSYDSVISAEHAIEQMNGFQIGSKRLKVQHKRVHHRPPMAPMYPAGAVVPHQAYREGIPPSIEVSSEGDETVPGQATSSQSTQSHDVEGITSTFANLKTSDETGAITPSERQE